MSYVEINTAANPAFLDTTQFTGAGATTTLAQAYANGAAAADQTMLIKAADGGPVIAKANAAATGALLQVQDSAGNTIASFLDNATMTFVSYAANGATAVGYSFDTFVSLSTSGAHIADFSDLGTPQVSIAKGGLILGLNAPNGYLSLNASTSQLVFGVNTSHKSTVSLTEDTASIIGGVANGATAVGTVIDTVNTLSNAAARVLSIRTNTAVKVEFDGIGNVYFATAGAGIVNAAGNKGILLYTDHASYYGLGFFGPDTTEQGALGDATKRWNSTFAVWYDTKIGAQLTAANTITPTAGCHHVTGNTVIKTIAITNFPTSGNFTFTLIADTNTVNWDATGNIAVAGTVTTALRTIIFTYDATAAKWYPSAVA
jgi:hypothetical protein